MKRSLRIDKSAFLNCITNVISICTKKKMLRIYTRRIITRITNKKTFRYRPDLHSIHQSVCLLELFTNEKITMILIS